MKQKTTEETWQQIYRDATAIADRISRRLDAEVAALQVHCPGVPPAALRHDLTKGSTDLLALARYFASQAN